eukprot:1642873-Rhodomonas_salina.1
MRCTRRSSLAAYQPSARNLVHPHKLPTNTPLSAYKHASMSLQTPYNYPTHSLQLSHNHPTNTYAHRPVREGAVAPRTSHKHQAWYKHCPICLSPPYEIPCSCLRPVCTGREWAYARPRACPVLRAVCAYAQATPATASGALAGAIPST